MTGWNADAAAQGPHDAASRALPRPATLSLSEYGGILQVTLNRPEVRNAMSLAMVEELLQVLDHAEQSPSIRALELRGAGGHFCAGGDIRDMVAARKSAAAEPPIAEPAATADLLKNPFAQMNRCFGSMIQRYQNTSLTVIVVLEGAVLGGGFGLACVSDIALSLADARFGLPETGLGIPPAQIAPFVVRRIGLTAARYLALSGLRIDGTEAGRIGLVHEVLQDRQALDQRLQLLRQAVLRCAPGANAHTKRLLLDAAQVRTDGELSVLLDDAARAFSAAIDGPEGREGAAAFLQKRPPGWTLPKEESP